MREAEMMDDPATADPLASPVPALTATAGADMARRLFGLREPTARLLSAERDLNLLVTSREGAQFVMKVANAAEKPEATGFQTAALRHVETVAPELPVPRIVRTVDGATEARVELDDGRAHTVRLLSFLHGRPLDAAPRSPAQRRNLAGCLARLDLALESYRPAFRLEDLSWNIVNLPRLEPLLAHQDEERRQIAAAVMDRFSREVAPALPGLRKQVIYNDLNAHNVLVDEDDPDAVTGIIDFGDLVHAPLVNDLAIACAYQFGGSADPLGAVGEFVEAYHRTLPLSAQEAELLPALIAARLATTVLITGWRARLYPHNSAYILRNNALSWAALHILSGRSDQQLKAWARRCCGMET